MVHVCLQIGQEKPDFAPALGLEEEPLVIPKNKNKLIKNVNIERFYQTTQYVH